MFVREAEEPRTLQCPRPLSGTSPSRPEPVASNPGLEVPMPRFPKPFFKKSHQAWYVQLDGRQVRLGPDEAEAHRRYHALVAEGPKHDPPPSRAESPQLVDISTTSSR